MFFTFDMTPVVGGLIVFPDFPFPDLPKPDAQILETIVLDGTSSVRTITLPGTIDQAE